MKGTLLGVLGFILQPNLQIYILLVCWQKSEAHTIGFRQSPEYQEWRSLLHHFYDPFPTVEHYEMILSSDKCLEF